MALYTQRPRLSGFGGILESVLLSQLYLFPRGQGVVIVVAHPELYRAALHLVLTFNLYFLRHFVRLPQQRSKFHLSWRYGVAQYQIVAAIRIRSIRHKTIRCKN